MLGTELDLRLLNYRDTTPLKNGQVDDDPYGGGAGMVLRVDVVAAALDAAYGEGPGHRVVALTPQGRQLDQELVEELAGEEHLTLLSSRFEGFDERIVEHLATDAVSIGPYVLSGGELPAMVAARRDRTPASRGARERGVGHRGELLRGARRRARVPALHAARRVSRLARAGGPALRRSRTDRGVATSAEPRKDRVLRNPIDVLTHGLPRQWRIAIDWAITILGAVAIVLAIKAYVVNPYRIPSSSMEPTLHCARPGSGCESRFSDRVLANRFIYHFRDPKRGEIVVFKTPPAAQVACTSGDRSGGGETFVKRLIALPGDRWREQNGFIYINGKKLDEPYVEAGSSGHGDDSGEDRPARAST